MTGRVIFAQNADEQLPMASTTKIMSTLLALESGGLDTPFTVDAQAIRVEGSSMGLKEGDTVTLRALCYGMMLPSGNDAANAAAVRVAGGIPDFVELMNQKAAQLGMENTSFGTPSGLDADGHHSTARDMAMLLREALKNPEFEIISSSKTAKLSYGNPPYDRWLTNHNRLLWSCEGTIGGKTGFTKESGRCLISAVRRDGVTLICATLGCPDDWNVHSSLYKTGFAALSPVDLSSYYAGLRLPVIGGTGDVTVTGGQTALLPLAPDEAKGLVVSVQLPPFLYAPVEQGEFVGTVAYSMGSVVLWKEELKAANAVPLSFTPVPDKPTLWERMKTLFEREK